MARSNPKPRGGWKGSAKPGPELAMELLKGAHDLREKRDKDDDPVIMDLIAPMPGFNLRFFSYDHRMTLFILYTKSEFVEKVSHQIYSALRDGKTFLVSIDKGCRYIFINPTAKMMVSLLSVAFAASNAPLIKQLVEMLFH